MDSGWVSAAIGTAGAVGAVGGFLISESRRKRDALPILRPEFSVGSYGFQCHLTIVNRLNEDLYIQKVVCRGEISFGEYDYDDGGSLIPDSLRYYPCPIAVSWRVGPLGTETFRMGFRPRPSRLAFSIIATSSSRTLANKRLKVVPIQKP